MNTRRKFLIGSGTTITTILAGCTNNTDNDNESTSSNETNNEKDEGNVKEPINEDENDTSSSNQNTLRQKELQQNIDEHFDQYANKIEDDAIEIQTSITKSQQHIDNQDFDQCSTQIQKGHDSIKNIISTTENEIERRKQNDENQHVNTLELVIDLINTTELIVTEIENLCTSVEEEHTNEISRSYENIEEHYQQYNIQIEEIKQSLQKIN